MIAGRLVKLDPANRRHVAAATALTLELFPHSPAGRLGSLFLLEFYFRCLPELGLIDCLLYEVEEQFVGFIVYTAHPHTFIQRGTRARFLRLAATVSASLVLRPARVAAVLDVRGQDRWRRAAHEDPGLCEMLTFGVLPAFRRKIDRASGRRISRLLFETALLEMLERGKERCLLVVSKTNAVNGFYHKYRTRHLLKDYSNPHQELWVFDLDRSLWVADAAPA